VYASYFEAMAAVVETYEGVVEKFIGDAVVGVFGAPVTHEDDPERAVRAGIAMQAALAELNERLAHELGEELSLRVGVHTGEVIASAPSGDTALVTGDTTSIAARLQGVAPPGSVVVGERTHRDTIRAFQFQSLGEFSLKGVPHPTRVWVVTGEAPTEAAASDRPFVGRADELALLEVLLQRCTREGRAHVVTVVGPAGVGKSRLAFEFTSRAAGRNVRGRCLPYGRGLRLWPLAEIVKTEAAILDSDPPDVMLAKAEAETGRHFEGPDAGAGRLHTLLSSIGIPVEPDPLAGVGPEAARRMIVDAWSRYFASLAAGGPVTAWIEDVHWADDALLDLLERVAGRTEAPVLFLCSARPELFDRTPTWGAGGSTLDLRALSADEMDRLIENLLDGAVDPALLSAVVERTGGNPFFATEMVRTLEEDGSIARHGGAWAATGDIAAAMPDTVQAAIAARIDRLAPPVKAVLQMASVVGRTFWTGAWNELSGHDVDTAIETLVDRNLVRHRRESSIAGAEEFTFEHALIREVAYNGIPRARRADAHRAVVEWMDDAVRGRDEEFAEVLAYHAEEAGDLERLTRFAVLAGHRHRRVFASEDAIRWYDRASEAAEQSLPTDRFMTLRAEILHSRGEAFEQLGRYEEALADFEAALEVARSSTWAWLRAQEYVAIVGALRSLERYEDAEGIIPDALHEARDAGFEYVEARVLCLSGELAWDRGDAARAREQLQDGLRIAQESRDLEGEAFARTGLLQVGLCLGPFDRAISDGVRARQLWQRLGHRPAAVGVAHRLGTLRALTGSIGPAETLHEEARRESRELGMPRDLSFSLVGLALVARARGDVGRAIELFAEAVDVAAAARATTASAAALTARIMLWQEIGVAHPARDDLRAIGALPDIPTSYLAPVRLAADAWLRVVGGEPDDARKRFARARALAEGLLISRIACGAIEIRTWDAVGDTTAMVDAATWMVEDVEGGPIANALAAWARARAGAVEPLRAVEAARQAGDHMLLWRACALADGGGDAKTASVLRDEARAIVGHVAESLAGTPFHGSFVARADVASVLG
jgi:tetratricopeptide (TPR) repeat protein